MTLEQIEDRIMTRLGLTTPEQRRRIRDEINDRYRQVTSAVNLARTRRGTRQVTTASGSTNVVMSGVTLLETLYDPTIRKRPLTEVSMPWIRARDSAGEITGPPEVFATLTHLNDVLTLHLYPTPDGAYTYDADVLLAGEDLTDPDDAPGFPSDYHDILVDGVLADEYSRVEKAVPMAERLELKFERRLSELRLHLARAVWLSRQVTDNMAGQRYASQPDQWLTVVP